jgi:F0F1-type ATP synthase assembly protein I
MPEDSSSGPESSKQKVKNVTSQAALAMELPFTLVGAVVVAGVIGYFLDQWLHTSPWLMLVLGGLGFFGGVREVLRRLPAGSESSTNGSKPKGG